MPPPAPQPYLLPEVPNEDVEALLDAEEQALMLRAQALERELAEHKAHKAAALEAKRIAEEKNAAAAEFERWQAELRSETERAISQLNRQRTQQLERCAQFDAKLQANIAAMESMRAQVRRRADAIGTAFDACSQRLSASYRDAVARRAATLSDSAAPTSVSNQI